MEGGHSDYFFIVRDITHVFVRGCACTSIRIMAFLLLAPLLYHAAECWCPLSSIVLSASAMHTYLRYCLIMIIILLFPARYGSGTGETGGKQLSGKSRVTFIRLVHFKFGAGSSSRSVGFDDASSGKK